MRTRQFSTVQWLPLRGAPRSSCGSSPLRTRRRGLAVLLGGLALAVALAGCGGGVGAGPLAAASVNGQSVSVTAYQRMLSILTAGAALQQQSVSYQTPAGRATLAGLQQTALDLLTNTLVIHQQVGKLHLTIDPKAVAAQLQQYTSEIQNVLAQDPSNQSYLGFKSAVAAVLKQHPGNNDVAALIAGSPSLGDTFTILALEAVELSALVDHAKVPQAHLRMIFVTTQQQASDLQKQVEHNADFGKLAMQFSSDKSSAVNGGEIGTAAVGKLGQIDKHFDELIFGSTANYTQNPWYVIVPFSGKYVLCEVTKRTTVALASISDQQTQTTTLNAWLAVVLRPAADIQQYVAVDATPTTSSPGQ